MFARVITAQPGAEGFDGAIRLAGQQLPAARQMPGFKGYYAETGKLVTVSLWQTREQMEAVTAGTGAVRHPGPGPSDDGTHGTAPGNLRSHDARLSHTPSRSRLVKEVEQVRPATGPVARHPRDAEPSAARAADPDHGAGAVRRPGAGLSAASALGLFRHRCPAPVPGAQDTGVLLAFSIYACSWP